MSDDRRAGRVRSVVRQGTGQHARQRRGEGGFTLAELLVVIAILGIIAGVLGLAFVVSGKSAADTTQRLKESHDAQVASAYLATDVQSARSITTSQCAPTAPLTGQANLVNFNYDDANSVASWYYGTSSGEQQVVRTYCASGGSLLSQAPIVHFAGATPTVSCYTRSGSTDSSIACANGAKPTKVKIDFVDHNSLSNTNDYTYAVSGTRRNYDDPASPGGITGYPPVLTLIGGVAIDLSAGHVGFHVGGGNVAVNSSAGNAASFGNQQGQFTLDPGYALQLLTGGGCSGTGCTGITVTHGSSPLEDPLYNLPAPPTSGANVYVYNSTFSPSGTLAPGIYILNNGMSLNGGTVTGNGVLLYFAGGSLNMGGNASLQITPYTSYPYSGMSIWLPRSNTTGSVSFSGGSSGTSVGGLIYAPAANVNISGGGNGPGVQVGSIIAGSITGNGGGTSPGFCVNLTPAQCAAF